MVEHYQNFWHKFPQHFIHDFVTQINTSVLISIQQQMLIQTTNHKFHRIYWTWLTSIDAISYLFRPSLERCRKHYMLYFVEILCKYFSCCNEYFRLNFNFSFLTSLHHPQKCIERKMLVWNCKSAMCHIIMLTMRIHVTLSKWTHKLHKYFTQWHCTF